MPTKLILLCLSVVLISCSNGVTTTTTRVFDRSSDFKSKSVTVSDTFSNTSQFIGSEVFLRWDDTTDVLMKITDIAFMRDELGMVVVSKFTGTTTWGSESLKGIQLDRDSALRATGFQPTSSFEGSRMLDSAYQLTVQGGQVKFRTAMVNGHKLLCLSNFFGKRNGDLLSFELKLPSTCLGVLMFDCVNFLTCGGRCPKIRTSDYWNTTTCSCPSGGICYLIPDGTDCVTTDCDGTCYNLTGWASYCICY